MMSMTMFEPEGVTIGNNNNSLHVRRKNALITTVYTMFQIIYTISLFFGITANIDIILGRIVATEIHSRQTLNNVLICITVRTRSQPVLN